MSLQRYSVNQHTIQALLVWITTEEIAIPEIQRPFVWEPVKVRNLLDSLYWGYPIGYLIAWRNPNVKLKDGTISVGKRILIDGQQRVTALMAALLGREVVTQEYETIRIQIAFNPRDQKFEVANSAIRKDTLWIPDITEVFTDTFKPRKYVNSYVTKNKGVDADETDESIERLRGIVNNPVGLIELNSDLSIEEVTEIFIRVNKEGTPLGAADFAMSKIASNEKYDGGILRKAIDYFCHLSVAPEFYRKIRANDKEFASTEFFQKMSWLKSENDDIYDPSYTDMLRVAFTSEFKRGKLEDLVALLSGRNFETKQYEDVIAQQSFAQLKKGILQYVNETHFKRFMMIIRSAGFIDTSLISSKNALNFAYIIYLTLRAQSHHAADAPDIERAVRRWFVMSLLTSRYSGQVESTFDADIRRLTELGFEKYARSIEQATFSNAFWSNLLPQQMNTSSTASPFFSVFRAAQIKLNDKGFLSRDITVKDLIENKSDVHHLFPRGYLKKCGFQRSRYNQIANFAITQSEINIAVGDRPPNDYFKYLKDQQVNGGKKRYGGITDPNELAENLKLHCIPDGIEKMTSDDYENFLEERRKLMAAKIKQYFATL